MERKFKIPAIIPLYNPTNFQGKVKLSDFDSIQKLSSSVLNDVKEVFAQKDYEVNNLIVDVNSYKNKPVNNHLVDSLKNHLSDNANIVFAYSQGNLIANDI